MPPEFMATTDAAILQGQLITMTGHADFNTLLRRCGSSVKAPRGALLVLARNRAIEVWRFEPASDRVTPAVFTKVVR